MTEELHPGIVKLSGEQQERLKSSKKDIDESKRLLGVLQKMGMDTKELQDKINWAEEVQKTLLQEFS